MRPAPGHASEFDFTRTVGFSPTTTSPTQPILHQRPPSRPTRRQRTPANY